ncbi:DUF222 domain-containing protein [Microbacterium sp. NPDC089318]
MTFATEITDSAAALIALLGEGVELCDLAVRVSEFDDAETVAVAEASAALIRSAELAQVAAAGVIAARSTRDAGQSGLAQSRGHRTAASLLQDLTGSTKADAARKVRVGESLLTSAPAVEMPDAEPPAPAWDAPLTAALVAGRITAVQQDAIRLGLGEPPSEAVRDAWADAAEQLVSEAAARSLEELRNEARAIRDRLDPDGAHRRFLERHERRSFRLWTDADGNRRGSFLFDDEGGLLADTVLASALRPRRGGPRFVDSAERERADELSTDERTNDQLAYDLFIDVLRAGALADAETVFGTRQAGVRLVQVVDASGRPEGVAHSEDGLVTLPPEAADQRICDSGHVPVTVDMCGNPLDVGREQRLFTPRQRIALAVRDGGCRWPGCDRPASYCESHHIDEWKRDGGRTDIDRGILLCRFHHMNLHHHGWRLTRSGKDDFVLHPPGSHASGSPPPGSAAAGQPIGLRPRAALTAAWAGIDPPPRRFRPTG